MVLCHSVSADGKAIICYFFSVMANLANQESHANTGQSKAIKRGDHNAFTPYHPRRLLSARYYPAFFGPFGPTMNQVASPWKPTFGCEKTLSFVL